MGERGGDVKGPNDGNPNSKDHDNLQLLNDKTASRKGKSCIGCLYYSSTLKSNSRHPVCVGITRSLPKVPHYVGRLEMKASKEGRSLAYFKYGCVGYSVYSDMKNHRGDAQETQKGLPACGGFEVLVYGKFFNIANSTPAHAHNKDNHAIPQPRINRPAQSASDDFFSRFTRNANVVASGVAKNVRKVGNQIKKSVDDILYPYRRRPK